MVSFGVTTLALILCFNHVLGVSHPHNHLPGFHTERVPRERKMHIWTALYIMWSVGTICLAWVAYQAYRWWKIHNNSQTYQTLLEHDENSTSKQRIFLSDSLSEYLKQTNTFGLTMTVCSMAIVLYVTIYTIHVAHFVANHKLGVHALSAYTFKRSVSIDREAPVGVTAQDFVDHFGGDIEPFFTVEDFEKIWAEAALAEEETDYVMTPVTITKVVHVGECTGLPLEDPGNHNKEFTFECDADGNIFYTYWEQRTMCTGHKFTGDTPHPVHDSTFEGVSMWQDEDGNPETGELELTCDPDTKDENGEYTQIIMKQNFSMDLVPCDNWVDDEQMTEVCERYADQEETYTALWECDTCYGIQLGKDSTSDDWEVHDILGCVLIPILTPFFRDANKHRVLRGGGDAVCQSYEAADPLFLEELDNVFQRGGAEAQKKFFETGERTVADDTVKGYQERGARRILSNGVLEKVIPEELVAERQSNAYQRQQERFHNHEKRDEISQFIEKQYGVNYNADKREWQVADGHDEASVRHKMRKHGLEKKSDRQKASETQVGQSHYSKAFRNYASRVDPYNTYVYGDNGQYIQAYQNKPEEQYYAGWCPRLWIGDHRDSSSSSQNQMKAAGKLAMEWLKSAECGFIIAKGEEVCNVHWTMSLIFDACDKVKVKIAECKHKLKERQKNQAMAWQYKKDSRHYMDNMLGGYCGSPKQEQWGNTATCTTKTCSGNTWFYPGWDGSVSFSALNHVYIVGVGFAASLDSVAFTYYYYAGGYTLELAAIAVASMQNTHVGSYSTFLGQGSNVCFGIEFPFVEVGWNACFGWEHGGNFPNNFQIGMGAGFGMFPVAMEYSTGYVWCIDAGCV